MVGNDARDFHVKFTSLVSCQKVIEAVAHLADEKCHARLLVIEVKIALDSETDSVESIDNILDLVAWNKETVKFPLDSHEENAINAVYILIEINDVSVIVRDEFGNLRDNTLTVRAVKEKYCGRFHIANKFVQWRLQLRGIANIDFILQLTNRGFLLLLCRTRLS